MISANNVTYRVGKKALFEEVNIKFTEGNCYGLIGANGAGKSTFLKILSGALETTNGDIVITPGQRLSVLEQDHFKYDTYTVLDVVIMGNQRLYDIMKEKDAIYAKEDFTEEDGIRASELEGEFAEMDGWQAESDAEILLSGIGLDRAFFNDKMENLSGEDKVKVLLAQSLFGNPDVLILDEPTNYLDINAKIWLENFLLDFKNTVIVVSHDRHFLNKVCTHILDIDYGKIKQFIGNYDFWLESSELIQKQMKDSNKKKEEVVLNKVLGALIIIIANVILAYNKGKFQVNKYFIMAIVANFFFAVAMLLNVGISDHFNLAFYTWMTVTGPAIIISILGKHSINDLKKEFKLYDKPRFFVSAFAWALMLNASIRAYQLGSVIVVASLFCLTPILNSLAELIFHGNKDRFVQKSIFYFDFFLAKSTFVYYNS